MLEKKSFFRENRDLLVFTALGALVLAIYWQTTSFGFINLDDNQYVYENAALQNGLNWDSVKWAFTAFHSANWHPLTWLTHAFDIQLFGLNAGGHHATNIILHLINSCLAFVVFSRMTGSFWKSAVIAAVFAVHPAHVESVAWIAERKDVLSAMFWLLTMLAYVKFAERVNGRKDEEEKEKRGEKENFEGTSGELDEISNSPSPFHPFTPSYLLTLALFAFGLMAKPMLVTLPFVLLLMDFWSLERLKKLKDLPFLAIEKLPFFVLSAVSSYVTVRAQRASGAVESLDSLSLDTRFINALVSYAKYIMTFFYPAKLAVWYPYDRDFPVWQIAASIVLLLGVTAFCLWQIKTRKFLLMGWLWFLGTLVPVIGIVQVGAQPMADRYTYIPYFGLLIMLVWGLSDLFECSKLNQNIARFLLAAAIVVFAILSFRQTSFWQENETLYKHTLAVTKDNFLISHNLCYSLTIEDRLDEAEIYCQESIRVKPDYYEAHNTYGILFFKRGDYTNAEREFQEAARLAPSYALAFSNLAIAQALLGKPEESEANLEKAVRMSGENVPPSAWISQLNDVAISYTKQEKYQKAAENLARILTADPKNANARANLALTFYHLKRYDEAQKLIESAIQLNPNEAIAFNTYGLILLAQNRKAEAAGLFRKALELKPDYAEAKENLNKATSEK